MTEMQELSDNLHSLNIAEEAQTGSPSSSLADSPDHWDYNAEGDAAQSQWREFHSFMNEQAINNPYPKYLYRAHVHGHPFPRWLDVLEGEYSDTFGSDLHLWLEHDAQLQMFMPMGDPMDSYTVEEFFWMLNRHLDKTSISLQEQSFLSPLVSLSGDFRWTMQRICRVSREPRNDQLPGLAIFNTSMINPTGARVYRVKDMLAFFESRLSDSSVRFPPKLHRWARNADEYICWSLVPREALTAFAPLPDLIEGSNGGEEAFLTEGFVGSNYLSDFGQRPLVYISPREYTDRASRFVRSIITDISSWGDAMQLFMHIKEVLLYPWTWGYKVAESKQVLDEAISSSVEEALDAVFWPDD